MIKYDICGFYVCIKITLNNVYTKIKNDYNNNSDEQWWRKLIIDFCSLVLNLKKYFVQFIVKCCLIYM